MLQDIFPPLAAYTQLNMCRRILLMTCPSQLLQKCSRNNHEPLLISVITLRDIFALSMLIFCLPFLQVRVKSFRTKECLYDKQHNSHFVVGIVVCCCGLSFGFFIGFDLTLILTKHFKKRQNSGLQFIVKQKNCISCFGSREGFCGCWRGSFWPKSEQQSCWSYDTQWIIFSLHIKAVFRV